MVSNLSSFAFIVSVIDLIMRYIYSLLLVIFISFTSSGQTFSVSQIIRMSKMDLDEFDTYVTSKGYVFFSNDEDDGIFYALNVSSYNEKKADKFISFPQDRGHIHIQTHNRFDYLQIKNQLKALGFKLVDSQNRNIDGKADIRFVYRKGISGFFIYVGRNNSYQIDYVQKYNWSSGI